MSYSISYWLTSLNIYETISCDNFASENICNFTSEITLIGVISEQAKKSDLKGTHRQALIIGCKSQWPPEAVTLVEKIMPMDIKCIMGLSSQAVIWCVLVSIRLIGYFVNWSFGNVAATKVPRTRLWVPSARTNNNLLSSSSRISLTAA